MVDLLINRVQSLDSDFAGLFNSIRGMFDEIPCTDLLASYPDPETDDEGDDDLHDSISLFAMEGRMIPPNEYSQEGPEMQGFFLISTLKHRNGTLNHCEGRKRILMGHCLSFACEGF